jgi:nucleoside-diphosphate-sugar epimerase
VRIFVAGASGVVGVRLVPLLVAAGHVVAGMTHSPQKAEMLRDLGAQPVICDVFDADALTGSVTAFAPDVVLHQMTDLPDRAADIPRFAERSNRMLVQGTRNLLAAAAAAHAGRVIAQSISWELPGESGRAAYAEHERAVLEADGVVIRYAQLWGPGTYYENEPPEPPRVHVDDAARQTLPALDVPLGVTLVADDRAAPTDTD